MSSRQRLGIVVASVAALVILAGLSWVFLPDFLASGRVVRTYTDLLTASYVGDLNRVRDLCSQRYLAHHELKPAPEGGVVGLPRGIHKNFRVWKEGQEFWLCPTNRIGPVYQFVREGSQWKFDGSVGILRGGGAFLPLSDETPASP